MPSIFGHAIVGATASYLSPKAKRGNKLFWIVTILCTVIADADVVTFALGAKYDSFFGHRGFFHSLFFASLIGFVAAAIYRKTLKIKSKKEFGLFFYFFLVTLTHPLLDAMTNGGHGVALFSPFNVHRYFYSYRPIYVSPLSIAEFFNHTAIRIIFRELVFILLPCLLVIALKESLARLMNSAFSTKVPKIFSTVSWTFLVGLVSLILISFSVYGLLREELVSGINGVDVYQIEATVLREKVNNLDSIPLVDLPGKKIWVNYKDLVKNNLLNTVLIPERQPWSGSFFPTWLGGVSGRWQDSYFIRIWKTLMGDRSLTKSNLLDVIHSSATGADHNSVTELNQLAPTEKYDIAVGDYYLTASRFESNARGRGLLDTFPNTPFWAGYCNSISLAAIYEKEPKQAVRVLNPDGYEVTFYPNDIKALLGVSYLYTYPQVWDLGNRCELDGPKSEACLDVNPSALVIALTNLVGRAKTSFLIDKEPFLGIQNAPIRKAEVKVINPPYFTSERQSFFKVEDLTVKWLMDVEINLTLSKITPYNSLDEDEEEVSYRATLGLDQNQNLVGGRWEDPFNHPDFAWGGGSISTVPGRIGNQLMGNRSFEWAVIQEIVEQSSNASLQVNPIEVAKIIKVPISHGFAFKSENDGISGGISYLKLSNPIQIYGRLEGEHLNHFSSVDLVLPGNKSGNKEVLKIASGNLSKISELNRALFKLEARGTIENLENLLLRFNKSDGPGFIEFHIPFKQKFESPLNTDARRAGQS